MAVIPKPPANVPRTDPATGIITPAWALYEESLDAAARGIVPPTPEAFGHQLLHVREEQAAGVNGTSTMTTGAWRTRVLNTVTTNEISGASLASNQISLPAGVFYGIGRCCNYSSNYTIIKFRNVTDSADLMIGDNCYFSTATAGADDTQSWLEVSGRFTLAAAKTIELQMQSSAAGRNIGINLGVINVYSDVKIFKVG